MVRYTIYAIEEGSNMRRVIGISVPHAKVAVLAFAGL